MLMPNAGMQVALCPGTELDCGMQDPLGAMVDTAVRGAGAMPGTPADC